MSGKPDAALSIRKLSKSFGGVHAVSDCSFDVTAGSITGLIGPNGAGKTTLFNLVAGALTPTRGAIHFNGDDVTGHKAHELFRRGIVRTFQIPHEFARMSVLENLMMVPDGQPGENLFQTWFNWPRVISREREIRHKAEETLNFLRLDHLKDERAGNLSGGQKKLLELGRTAMTDARLILLDEPAAGVNRTLLAELSDIIRELNQQRRCTFLIIEHDMNFVEQLCDPVICMAQGTVLVEGSFEHVRQQPAVLEAYMGSAIQ
jgi:branched-chain amino acid transport system ATP-binding protein